jgi:Flp pilus assembly protein TadD
MTLMDGRPCLRSVVLLVPMAVVLATCGCAARSGAALSGRFIKQGEPKIRIESPMPAPGHGELDDYTRKVRELQSRAVAKSSLLPTIEGRDKALGAALVRLTLQESAENHRLVAAAYRQAGVEDYAYRHLQRALKLNPCDAEAYDALAQLWRDWDQAGLALGEAYRGLYCRPDSAPLYNTLGTVLLALGQAQNARHAFERALQIDSRAAFAMNNLCYMSLGEGDPETAQRFCARALAIEPTMTAAGINLGLAYAIGGDSPRAEQQFGRGPDEAIGHFNVGVLRMSQGKYGAAAQAFDRASVAKPSYWIASRRAAQARGLALTSEQNYVDR